MEKRNSAPDEATHDDFSPETEVVEQESSLAPLSEFPHTEAFAQGYADGLLWGAIEQERMHRLYGL